MIAIICYHNAKHKVKTKKYWGTSSIKMEKNNELKKTSIRLVKLALSRYYCFDDIIKIEDFDFGNILSDEK